MGDLSLTSRAVARTAAAAAIATLFAMSAAHALLETARDALFLAGLAPEQLPWMYIGIAAAAAVISRLPAVSGRARRGRHALAVLLVATSAVTLAIWAFGAAGRPWMLRALYVWTGVNATLTGLQLWLVLGDRWPLTEAKRTFRWIALGGLAGGIAGAAFARALVSSGGPADRLILASALVQAAASAPALLISGPGRPTARPRVSICAARRLIREQPYVRGLAALALLSTMTFTAVDFVFKSHVAREVPPAQLAWAFATFYTVLNALAFVTQLAVTGWLMRILGVLRAQHVLPALLLAASAGVVGGLGVAAALVLKLTDGALREAHRTTSELLWVPTPHELRSRAKPFLDVVVRRGGQALASMALLGAMALPRAEVWVAAGTSALCVAWILQANALRRPYLNLFRTALRDRAPAELPPVDLEALEALVAALGSDDDAEVIAAMDVLADQGRARLIPSLVLHHPSEDVALHALAVFERAGRRDASAMAERLLTHPSERLRAAALQARAAAPGARALLEDALTDASPSVRAVASIGLVATGEPALRAREAIDALVRDPHPEARLALARAIAHRRAPALAEILRAVAGSDEPEVLVEVARAIGALQREEFLPVLLRLLAPRETRVAAREAFLSFGDVGLRFLETALGDVARIPHEVRRHVPRTISRFPPERAARILLARLVEEPDGMVRFKILRGLGRIVADSPTLRLDRRLLERAIDATLEAAFRLVRWRTVLEAGARADPRRATPVHELLVALLRDKERHATDRLFRLLALQLRGEDLSNVHRGLRNADPRLRASSLELLEHVLPRRVRAPVLALIDDAPGTRRLAEMGRNVYVEPLEYEGLLRALLVAPGDTLRSLTIHQVAALGLVSLRDEIVRLMRDGPTPLVERAAARALRALPDPAREVTP